MRTLALVLCSFLLLASITPASAQNEDEAPILTNKDLARASYYASKGSRTAAARLWKWLRGEWGAPDPNRVLDRDRNTFMHYVAAHNRLDILREAVRLGGDCNRRNVHAATPLHFAAAQNAFGPGSESLRILMRCEARPGVARECDRGGETGKSCRADPNVRDSDGDTPLHALYDGVEIPLSAPYLLPNFLGISRAFPSEGRGGKRGDILKFLVQEARVDLNVKNVKGDTPLRLAIRREKSVRSQISFLLKHGAEPDTRDKDGVTPLFEALSESIDSNYFEYDMKYLIALLIKHGADPDQRNAEGDTPLIWAAKEVKHKDGLKQLMEVLLKGGADPCLRDKSGKLAIDYPLNGSPREILLYKAGGAEDWATDICTRDLLGARKREKKLNLSRAVKREIQACLEELKLDPGKPGDEFGPHARKAIRAWQKREGKTGLEAAGYFTSGQADALLASAACKPPGPTPLCTGQTGSGCWMEYANRRGCYTWNPHPQPEETVTWSGRCVNGRASGRGKRVWRFRDGGVWKSSSGEGELRDGKEHGHWILRRANGTVSEGAYVTGKRSGHWVYRIADGKIWEGSIVDGKLQGLWVRHGEGEPAQQCRENGEKVDMSACLTRVEDRAMELTRSAQLRQGPGDAYSQKANLATGDKVKVKAEAGDWALVETSGGVTGFVQKSVLKAVEWAPGRVFRDCPNCPEMVVVPAGSFMMGSPSHEAGRDKSEGPRHRVTIEKPFAVGKYEVTFAEWDACVAGGGCGGYRPADESGQKGFLHWRLPRMPAGDVSWKDAKSYVKWLSQKTGKLYRLLTEAEWEYAARAGSTTRYSWGDEIGHNRTNCGDCGDTHRHPSNDNVDRGAYWAPVGSYPANPFGLHDMHGNVSEWVEDCKNYSYTGAPANGTAWLSGNCSLRATRGGCYVYDSPDLRSASRGFGAVGDRVYTCGGFRVARTLAP